MKAPSVSETDEHTTLLATVEVGGPERRHPHNVVRRFCTVALSLVLMWSVLAFLTSAILSPHHFPLHHHERHRWEWPGCKGRTVSYERLHEILLETPASSKAQEWSRYYTAGPHLAGLNLSQAVWTKNRWDEFGVKSGIVAYDAYINYPLNHRLAILERQIADSPNATDSWEVAFEASLDEDVLDADATSGLEDRVPTFHGYSASGNVTAPVVYVNYASYQDFEDLIKANISLTGKIAIARYGGIFRGLKVKRAQELGMVGVILYSDPGDDGKSTEVNGVPAYPEGPARNPSSVQRGSVQFLSIGPGDPTTPGYPSKTGSPRQTPEKYIPSIPSLPISYMDALPILKALNGHGPRSSDFNQYWTRNQGLVHEGVEYNIGPTPDSIVVNLYNEQNYTITPQWDVIGIINGTIADEVVVVGNHRDAWIAGGAGDPNSGSAVLNEVIRSFGVALKAGWKPLRTIVFASWDGEEYGLVGSTEWVEEYLPWLSATNVAYLNIDIGVVGPYFSASAAPLLDNIIHAAAAAVPSPNQTVAGQTIRDLWDGRISTMGSGSDFTAFQDHVGVPCIDIGFKGGPDSPVYHYHSNYDSFHWMETYGDPGFAYHTAAAQVLGLMTAQLADLPVLPFSAGDYTAALEKYIKQVETRLDPPDPQDPAAITLDLSTMSEDQIVALRGSMISPSLHDDGDHHHLPQNNKPNLHRLYKALAHLTTKATHLDTKATHLRAEVSRRLPWWHWPKRLRLAWRVRKVNTKYKYLERSFLHARGLDGRPWFKHVIFAPGLWTGYAGAVFPDLVDSIDAGDWDRAERWVNIIEATLRRAAHPL